MESKLNPKSNNGKQVYVLSQAEEDFVNGKINEYELADALEMSYTEIGDHIMIKCLHVKNDYQISTR